MQQKGYKRRNYFIKKDMQGKHIFLYFMIVVGGSVAFTIILGLFSADTMTITYEDYVLQIGVTPFVLLQKFFAAHILFIIFGGILLIATTMMISHRIAGPIYKFEKYVDSMLAGKLGEPLYLRSKDDGKVLAEKLNSLSKNLAETINELNVLSNEIDQQVEASANFHIARQVQEKNKKIQAILKRYTIDAE